jgi:dTDP-4-amino-4,6-dideoxygalactose transaminase
LRRLHESLRAELLEAVARVIDSTQFVLGSEVQALEEEIAAYSSTKFAIGCASGSDALLLALMALEIKPGDEIVTTPFTFFATGSAIVRLGARPVFVDIDSRTYNIDVTKVEENIGPRTRAMLPVHMYGQCANMDALLEIGRQHGIPIVEDAAQAIGAEDSGRRAGSMGAIGCFSFYPTKNLGGAGDGGMLTTSDEKLAQRLRQLRVHGAANEYYHAEVGINSRLDALQAAVLRVKLQHLDRWSAERLRIAERYTQLFAEAKLDFSVNTPFIRPEARHIFHQYVIRVPKRRDAVIEHLAQKGIGTKVYYPVPLHLQECFQDLGYKNGDFPHAELAALETVALPCYPKLTEESQQYVVDAFRTLSV